MANTRIKRVFYELVDNSGGAVQVSLPEKYPAGTLVHFSGVENTALKTITFDGGVYDVVGSSEVAILTPDGVNDNFACSLLFNGTKWILISSSNAVLA